MKMSVGRWWNDNDRGKTEELGVKTVSVPLCPLQIANRLAWDLIQGFAVNNPNCI